MPRSRVADLNAQNRLNSLGVGLVGRRLVLGLEPMVELGAKVERSGCRHERRDHVEVEVDVDEEIGLVVARYESVEYVSDLLDGWSSRVPLTTRGLGVLAKRRIPDDEIYKET